ncbi:hypothetical protein N7450_007257 [Penicillium hetheringtonii]|uniref:Uncharacterized protein n=1 Tax=Penicillium hetheringtonii TaxID=911720 RepID=A0AAD6DHS7_9EURO|nr:hypothetical protein N7450_007257 [Penicillium hetheringtonii]
MVRLSLSSDLSAFRDPERGTLGAMHFVVSESVREEPFVRRKQGTTIETIERDKKQKKLSPKKVPKKVQKLPDARVDYGTVWNLIDLNETLSKTFVWITIS